MKVDEFTPILFEQIQKSTPLKSPTAQPIRDELEASVDSLQFFWQKPDHHRTFIKREDHQEQMVIKQEVTPKQTTKAKQIVSHVPTTLAPLFVFQSVGKLDNIDKLYSKNLIVCKKQKVADGRFLATQANPSNIE